MGIRVLLCCFLLQNTDYKNSLLFTPFSATRFAMPVNSNLFITTKKPHTLPKNSGSQYAACSIIHDHVITICTAIYT